VRWEALFDDLAAQAEALDSAERAAEVAERARIEFGGLALIDRLRAAAGASVRLRLSGGLELIGEVGRVGSDWMLLDEAAGREALISLPAVEVISGLGRWSAPPAPPGGVTARLALRSALRGVARDRSDVRMHLRSGELVDATLDRVGADFVEAARHLPGEPRRRGEVRDVLVVPLGAIAALRRDAG
jgi:hypothetical protein